MSEGIEKEARRLTYIMIKLYKKVMSRLVTLAC